MKHLKLALLSLLFLVLYWPEVQAQDYQELGYDELLSELSSRTNKSKSRSNTLDSIMIHLGLGAIASVHQIRYDNRTFVRENTGFQILLGLDLLSENWAAEVVLRNFGQTQTASETRTSREYDLNVVFKDAINPHWGYRSALGIGTRYLKLTDPANNVNIEAATPTGVFYVGAENFVTGSVSFVIDLGTRIALITDTADKNSIDLAFSLNTKF